MFKWRLGDEAGWSQTMKPDDEKVELQREISIRNQPPFRLSIAKFELSKFFLPRWDLVLFFILKNHLLPGKPHRAAGKFDLH